MFHFTHNHICHALYIVHMQQTTLDYSCKQYVEAVTNQRRPPAPWWSRCLLSCCWWTQSLPCRPDPSAGSPEQVYKTLALWVEFVTMTKPRCQEVQTVQICALCPFVSTANPCCVQIIHSTHKHMKAHGHKWTHTDACWQTVLLIRL